MAMGQELRTKAIILTADEFEDMELFFSRFRLLEAGMGVDVIQIILR